ncbi:hypothetical protein EG328_005956 [Venturia inaequalis]|uniref:Uncharacterized protein n=1 Tax=Venturia inaequalis TaxID=5025 RepID=A0A8H3UJ20_VENIN|nr:hypothetical protein EG328_005956 [Venturia inaequalis]
MAPQIQQNYSRASVLYGPKDLRVESRVLDPPGPQEVQISLRKIAICGSDVHYYQHYRNGDILVKQPLSLGHESAGVIVATGSDVRFLAVGDRVALEVGIPCANCRRCNEGRYNICSAMQFRSSAKSFPHAQGTLQECINHPAAFCHKLRDDVSLEMGALVEPLSVGIHAVRRAGSVQGATILILGAGAVGLLVSAVCRMSGAKTVVISDVDAGRTEFAVAKRFADRSFVMPMRRSVNADVSIQIAKDNASLLCSVASLVGPTQGYDAVFECSGVPACLQTAIFATRPGGRVMIIGMGTPTQTLPISAAALREVDLCGVFRYADTYPSGIELLSRKGPETPDFPSLLTHRFVGLDAVEDAFRMATRKVDGEGNTVLKVVVELNNEM